MATARVSRLAVLARLSKLAGLARLVALAGLAGLALPATAQVYKWVDASGVTHYSDTPPPPSAPLKRPVELKPYALGSGDAGLPATLADAVARDPVTLYTTAQCAGCDQGRALLQARGIPYTERTVATAQDFARLKQLGSNGQLPLLLVGRARQVGYETSTWDTLLDQAGYPAQSLLPAGYRNPLALLPAAPVPIAPVTEAQEPPVAAPPALNAPPGFQF